MIDADWQDARGQSLARGLRKPFHVTAVDESPIDIKSWQVAPPAASLARTTDRHISRTTRPCPATAIAARDDRRGRGGSRHCRNRLGETRWQFTPEQPWSAGDYQLVVETTLEDLAGNAVGRAFDVDLFGPVTEHIETDTVSRPFTIAAP